MSERKKHRSQSVKKWMSKNGREIEEETRTYRVSWCPHSNSPEAIPDSHLGPKHELFSDSDGRLPVNTFYFQCEQFKRRLSLRRLRASLAWHAFPQMFKTYQRRDHYHLNRLQRQMQSAVWGITQRKLSIGKEKDEKHSLGYQFSISLFCHSIWRTWWYWDSCVD